MNQFQKDIIIAAVGYYLRYNFSYRGSDVCHTTIYHWAQEYSNVLYHLWKKQNRKSFYSWKMNETYIKIKRRWYYLYYRAIDSDGLNFRHLVKKKEGHTSSLFFLKTPL